MLRMCLMDVAKGVFKGVRLTDMDFVHFAIKE